MVDKYTERGSQMFEVWYTVHPASNDLLFVTGIPSHGLARHIADELIEQFKEVKSVEIRRA